LPEEWNTSRIALICGCAAVGLSIVFWDPAGRIWSIEKQVGLPFAIALALIAVSWRTLLPKSGRALALLILSFSALAIAAPRTDRTFMWPRVWQTGAELRDGFLRINQSLEYIRSAAAGSGRFWFDQREPSGLEFRSLEAAAGCSAVGFRFPELAADIQLPAHTTIVVPSTREDVPELAAKALNGRSLTVKLVSANTIAKGGVSYVLYILRIVRPPGSEIPLSLSPNGTLLETNRDSPLPAENWQLSGKGAFERDGGVLRLTTSNNRFDYAASYTKPLSADREGRYLFVLRCRRIKGRFTFGALKDDRSAWLAQAPDPVVDLGTSSMEFVVNLQAGQRIWLQTANNHPAGAHPTSFVIQGLNAYRLQ
jgi:hypothetical protein